MKYIAVFDDDFLSNFRLDDGGLTLVLDDKNGFSRATQLKPLQRNVLTTTEGQSVYLLQKHIDCLIEMERKEMMENAIKDMENSIHRLGEDYEDFIN
jgi:hypothetical protein